MLAQEEIVKIKGKRSKRQRHPSPLALTMSTSSGGGSAMSDGGASTSGELTRGIDEEEDMANCLILLAKGQTQEPPSPPPPAAAAAEVSFQCKTCGKSFPSFQALGGHRASHKKSPNPPSRGGESTILSLRIPTGIPIPTDEKRASRVHECSVCRAEFTSGQALGGHMRRHRPLPPPPPPPAAIGSPGESGEQPKRLRTVLSLDLNLPAPESGFALGLADEHAIVFATSLVDCHY